jgi:hypothetical protein
MAHGDSAYIQEWPENKLTLAQLRAIHWNAQEETEGPLADEHEDYVAGMRKIEAAIKKAEEGAEPRRKAESPVYFFGCMKGVDGRLEAGHYLYVEGPAHDGTPRKVGFANRLGEGILPESGIKIDGGFCPRYAQQTQYAKAKLTHWQGWTAVGFWDSSGDTRPGSDSNFFMKGTLDFEDAMEEASRAFDPVIARAEDKYGPISCVETARPNGGSFQREGRG